jgi:hypothetical protein
MNVLVVGWLFGGAEVVVVKGEVVGGRVIW